MEINKNTKSIKLNNKGEGVTMHKYEFFIAGRARNKENILKICQMFDRYNISYYCFLKNEENWGYGNKNQTPEEKQKEFESLSLKSEVVLNLFNSDLSGERNSKNFSLTRSGTYLCTCRQSCSY